MKHRFQSFRCCLVLVLPVVLFSFGAHAACKLPDWNPKRPLAAPQLPISATWVYTPGENFPPTELVLTKVAEGSLEYAINGKATLYENAATYTETNPLRVGEKVTIRFPVKLGARWTDHFSEEGEFRSRYEHYFYDYEEESASVAAAVENITVAAGSFKALRIDRVASWTKSNPRNAEDAADVRTGDGKDVSVGGVTLTQLWYVPDLGRAVLKAHLRVGDANYGQRAEDLLRKANAAVVELREFVQGDFRCAEKPLLRARQPDMYFPIGYAAQSNDSWEWALQMREHFPRRER